MFWLSYVILALIIIGLIYGYYSDMYLTQVLMIINLVIFIFMFGWELYSPGMTNYLYHDLAGRAIYLAEFRYLVGRGHSFLSLMFLHAGPMHIFGNIIVLFFIGVPLEDRVGKKWTLTFYLAAGVIATLGQYSFNWLQVLFAGASPNVLWIYNLGASGAVFGIMGSLVFLYPRDRITMIIPPLILPRVRVDLAVGAFIAIQTGIALISPQGNVAHAAHFTGFVGGMILGVYAKKVGIKEKSEGPVRDYQRLEVLVDDEETREIFEKIMEADERDVKEAWSEHLIENSRCPECDRELDSGECKCGFSTWED